MRLRYDWKYFLKRAFSVRVQVLMAVISTAVIVLPAAYEAGWVSLRGYAALMLLSNAMTMIFQVTKQKAFD